MLRKQCFCADTARERSGIWVHAGAYAIRPYETPCFYAGADPGTVWNLGHAGAYAIRPYETPYFYAGADPGMLGGRPKKGPEWAATKIPGRRGVEALQVRGEGAMSYWLVERALIS